MKHKIYYNGIGDQMKVISITPRGYCKGVINAINIAKKTKEQNPNKDIYILGRLVHNQHVVDELFKMGITTLDDVNTTRLSLLDKIDTGIVIFSAHGVSAAVYAKAIAKGLQIIDATCIDVKQTQDIIKEFAINNYEILYIGKKGHPEAESVLDLSDRLHLITSIQDIDRLNLKNDKIMVINQTTMSIIDIIKLHEHIQLRYPNAEIYEEICSATRVRQEAIINMEDTDLTYVVGDPHSNNTLNLAKLARLHSKEVRLIESVKQIDKKDLLQVESVAVTSGASTPTALTNQVISFLKNYTHQQAIPEVIDKII